MTGHAPVFLHTILAIWKSSCCLCHCFISMFHNVSYISHHIYHTIYITVWTSSIPLVFFRSSAPFHQVSRGGLMLWWNRSAFCVQGIRLTWVSCAFFSGILDEDLLLLDIPKTLRLPPGDKLPWRYELSLPQTRYPVNLTVTFESMQLSGADEIRINNELYR